jgi:hypothetical protein
MSIEPDVGGEHPDPAGASPKPSVVLAVATAWGAVAGYLTDWETAVTVFLAVMSVFTRKPD